MCVIVVHYIPLQTISSATNYSIFIVLLWNDVISLSVFSRSIMVLHRHMRVTISLFCQHRLHMFLHVYLVPPCQWTQSTFSSAPPSNIRSICLCTRSVRWTFKKDIKQSSDSLMSPEKKSRNEIKANESKPLLVAGVESFYFGLFTSEL